jgi:hypothetical protein
MQSIKTWIALPGLALPLLVCAPVSASHVIDGFGPDVQRSTRITVGDMLDASPRIPRDLYRRGGARGARHSDLAKFAWLEFIALNAPVGKRRGTTGGSFADSGATPTTRLAWETYHHRSELFPFNRSGPVPPRDWDDSPSYTYGVGRLLRRTYTTPFHLYNNLDETSQIGQNLMFFPQALGEDAQVLFEAKVNQVQWRFVAENFDGSLTNFTSDPVSGTLVLTPPITVPDNVIEVKASWRPLSSIPPEERYRYHVSKVIYYTGSDERPVAVTGDYALIGLHIIHKTRNYPTFVFATFEQVDVLDDEATGRPTGAYYIPTYDEIEYSLADTTTFPPAGAVYENPQARGFRVDRPRAYPNWWPVRLPVGPVTDIPGAATFPDGVHVPIVQPPTTNRSVGKVNAQVLRTMSRLPGFDRDFVWQYYRLKGVQAVPSNRETDDDFFLANISIESSQPGIQLFRGGVTIDTSTSPAVLTNNVNRVNVQDPKQDGEVFAQGGCMGCHGVAQTRNGFDFSFLFFGADGIGFSPDVVGVVSDTAAADRIDRYRGRLRR